VTVYLTSGQLSRLASTLSPSTHADLPHNLADSYSSRLVDEQHLSGVCLALLLLAYRREETEEWSMRFLAVPIWYLGKLVRARCEKHQLAF
jgi:hypothetical protein